MKEDENSEENDYGPGCYCCDYRYCDYLYQRSGRISLPKDRRSENGL